MALESAHALAAYNLLSTLRAYAPDGPAQGLVSEAYNRAYVDSHGESEPVVKMLAGMILDGLNHGNWPWVLTQPLLTGNHDTDEELIVQHLLEAARLARQGSGQAAQEVRDDVATLITNYGWSQDAVSSYIDARVNWPQSEANTQAIRRARS